MCKMFVCNLYITTFISAFQCMFTVSAVVEKLNKTILKSLRAYCTYLYSIIHHTRTQEAVGFSMVSIAERHFLGALIWAQNGGDGTWCGVHYILLGIALLLVPVVTVCVCVFDICDRKWLVWNQYYYELIVSQVCTPRVYEVWNMYILEMCRGSIHMLGMFITFS